MLFMPTFFLRYAIEQKSYQNRIICIVVRKTIKHRERPLEYQQMSPKYGICATSVLVCICI